jgi:hypothetical protein
LMQWRRYGVKKEWKGTLAVSVLECSFIPWVQVSVGLLMNTWSTNFIHSRICFGYVVDFLLCVLISVFCFVFSHIETFLFFSHILFTILSFVEPFICVVICFFVSLDIFWVFIGGHPEFQQKNTLILFFHIDVKSFSKFRTCIVYLQKK